MAWVPDTRTDLGSGPVRRLKRRRTSPRMMRFYVLEPQKDARGVWYAMIGHIRAPSREAARAELVSQYGAAHAARLRLDRDTTPPTPDERDAERRADRAKRGGR